jgi:NitT/TauT family transport system ATP-binding protein
MILEMARVRKDFDDICILDNLSLQVQKAEIVCLIGPSGCGKSTILNIIAGILPASQGEVVNHSGRTSYVFQEDRLLPWRNVYQNISVVNPNCPRKQVLTLIGQVGLAGFADYYPAQLSGGMRQRCAMARAFNYEADLLLMDEPLKSLDYNLRLEMIKYLLDLWENTSKAIIYVTHEIDEALLLGERILVLAPWPTKVVREFRLTTAKHSRKLTDHASTVFRNEIINLLQKS